ncbi:ankyrin repeat-containing domain protein [Fusarium oxysporum f. sp. albedinis]|nr:ankyrin repeat-containing domain protein [Fusarium oxysporum f. sp. albedinis]
MACSEGSLEMVKLLCKNNANLSSINHANSTPLHEALLRSDNDKEAIVDYLLTMEGLDVNHSSDAWGGCLNISCLNTGINVVEALLKAKAIVDSKDKIGRVPMHFALYRTTAHVEILLQANATLEALDLMERNALHFTVVSGRLDVVTYVLDRYPDFIRGTDIDGWSPLMWAIRICGRWDTRDDERAEIVVELIRRGANPQIPGEGLDRKWTARELAYYYGHDQDLINLLGPSDELLQQEKLQDNEQDNEQDNQRTARKIIGSFCDACLLDNYGFRYRCSDCENFVLCFKCYRSQDIIHPKHSFTNPSGGCEYEHDASSDMYSTDLSSTEGEMSNEEQSNGSGVESDNDSRSESKTSS